ncbi:T9SS type A sorting domain-containing protein [Aquirufa sp. ROCK2-A2]
MMNKLLKILFIQGILSASFLAVANDNTNIPGPVQLLINGSANSTVIGPEDKGQLFAISGCPAGSSPMWYWNQEKLDGSITGDVLLGSGPTRDLLADSLGNSYYTQPIGGEGGNARKWVEYSYKCNDSLNLGTPLSTHLAGKIKIYIQRTNPTYKYPVGNPNFAIGEYTNCNAGQDLIVRLSTMGCPTNEIFWVHPNSTSNTSSVGADSYWESINNNSIKNVSGGNVIPGATYLAKCKIQYYDEVSHSTVVGLTPGVNAKIPDNFVIPAPAPNNLTTYAYFKDRPNLSAAELCEDESITLTHGLLNGNYDLRGYDWYWGIDTGNGPAYNLGKGNKNIQVNTPGRYSLKLSNGIPACERNYDFSSNISTNRELKPAIKIEKPSIAGNKDICPGGNSSVAIANVSDLTQPNTYTWYINGVQNSETSSTLNIADDVRTIKATYVSLKQSSLGTNCVAPVSDEFTISPFSRPAQPVISKVSGSNGYCDYNLPAVDLTLEASNTSLAGDAVYAWKFGNNSIGGNTQQLQGSNVTMTEGEYSVILTDGNGCVSLPSDKFVLTKFISPSKPTITNTNGKDAYCDYNIPFQAIALESSNTTFGTAKYLWSTGSTDNLANITTEGTYTVKLTDENGCVSPEASYQIVKYTRPEKPTITNVNGKNAYCDYTIPFASVTLQSSNTSLVGSPIYAWSNGSTDATSTVTTEGTYSVTVTDENSCVSLPATYEIAKYTRPEKPVVTRKTGADAYCDYKFPVSDLTLESSNTSLVGDAVYTWNNVVKTKVIPVTTEGTYSVVVTDGNGCESVSSDAYTISKWTSPVAPSIAITGNKVNCALDETDKQITVAFSVSNASDKYAYEWFKNESSSVLSKTANLAAISSNGTYYSIQTDKNGCYSPKSEGIKVSFVPNPNFAGAKISKLGAYGLLSEGLSDWTNGTPGDFQWKAGSSLQTSVANNIKVSATNNGNGDYSVRRKYSFTVDNTPIVCFSNTVKYTFVSDPDFTGVAVYPNPTSGTVNIDLLDEWKNASVTVYDLVGRAVYTGTMNSETANGKSLPIDLSSLGSGIYILNIKSSTGDRSYQGKILVNK